jgi:hypothetical protein
VVALLLALSLAACESTQDTSARLEREAPGRLAAQKGVTVSRESRDVKVLSTDVVQDENGTAAVVRLRNTGKTALAQVPISIDVRGSAAGRSLFRNDDPGLEPTLAHVPLLRPGQALEWVNDQVTATDRPRQVKARIGPGRRLQGGAPAVTVSRPQLEQDPVSGVAAVGLAANRSGIEQRKLVIFAVARKGRRVVAAGRAQIARIKPHARVRYTIFFIGNPRGARISLAAPPSNLK